MNGLLWWFFSTNEAGEQWTDTASAWFLLFWNEIQALRQFPQNIPCVPLSRNYEMWQWSGENATHLRFAIKTVFSLGQSNQIPDLFLPLIGQFAVISSFHWWKFITTDKTLFSVLVTRHDLLWIYHLDHKPSIKWYYPRYLFVNPMLILRLMLLAWEHSCKIQVDFSFLELCMSI